ncbi:MAG: hypothetical protein LKG27_06630 [Clostridiaceae bacterium]|jgi:hypothetical protein|nr:hypothetical protein [Clostridiaceae bacterium]
MTIGGLNFNNFNNLSFRGQMTPQQMEDTEMAIYRAQEEKQIADAYGKALDAQKAQNNKDGEPHLANLAERLNNIHERYQADSNLMAAQRNLMSATRSLNYMA